MEISQSLDKVKAFQRTIDNLLEISKFKLKMGDEIANCWQLTPLYQKDDCSIGFVVVDLKDYGPCENHNHYGSKEFLIVISGSVMLNIDGSDVRVLNPGDCGVVEAGKDHFSRPLEDGTKIAYVCVPADKGMSKMSDALGEK